MANTKAQKEFCAKCVHRFVEPGEFPCNGCSVIGRGEHSRLEFGNSINVTSPGNPREVEGDALSTQVGGGHYKGMAIQPVEFIHKNGIGFCEGAAIKYLCRWRSKNGIEDLKKARHFIDLLIELES